MFKQMNGNVVDVHSKQDGWYTVRHELFNNASQQIHMLLWIIKIDD